MSTKQQIDIKKTKQVRIGIEYHKRAKLEATLAGETVKSFVESCLAERLGSINET